MAYFYGKGQQGGVAGQVAEPMATPGAPAGTQDVVTEGVGAGRDMGCLHDCRIENAQCKRMCRGSPGCVADCERDKRECDVDCGRELPDSDVECMSDADCIREHGQGWTCAGNRCQKTAKRLYCCKVCQNGKVVQVQSPNPCAPPTSYPCDSAENPDCAPPEECSNPNDCQEKYGDPPAGSRWECVAGKCRKAIIPPDCTSDADCGDPKAWECIDGKCHPREAGCKTDADCPTGEVCDNGQCVGGKVYCCKSCVDGRVKKGMSAKPCRAPDSYPCDSGEDPCRIKKECVSPDDCQIKFGNADIGYHWECKDEECTQAKDDDDGNGNGNGDGDGDGGCDGGYLNTTGGACSFGFESKGIGGEQWCCPTEKPDMGEWQWPTEMEDYYKKLLGWGQEQFDLGPYGGLGKFELPGYLKDLFPQMAERAGGLLEPYALPEHLKELFPQMTGRAGELLEPYGLPEDLQKLMTSLSGRAGEFMGRRPGYGDAAIKAMFGRDYDVMRQGGQATQEAMADWLRSEGLAGTGVAREAMRGGAWQTEAGISDLMRDVFLANEQQKRQDIYGYTGAAQDITQQLAGLRFGEEEMGLARTGEARGLADYVTRALFGEEEMGLARAGEARGLAGQIGQQLFGEEAANLGRLGYGTEMKRMAQSIFGQGMDYNKIIEAINAARRGEDQGALALLMQYLLGMGSLWG